MKRTSLPLHCRAVTGAEATISSTASARPGLPRVIVAATIGNVLEWFDFLVYGFFAVTIAEVFFPVGNPTVSLLITFGTFGPLPAPVVSCPPIRY